MIQLVDVSVEVNSTRLVSDISFTVDSGCFVALVGPNGAGKTTLIRAINGLITPASGQISLNDTDAASLSARNRSRLVATVPQETSLGFDFLVSDIVDMGRTPHRGRLEPATPDDREAVKKAMERTDTAQFASRSVKTLSGGERQRVLLARAIAQETPILLLDEPTANLDLNHQIQTLSMARELADDGKTVVAAIHDLSLAARFCDELILLADGELKRKGPAEEVLTGSRLESVFDIRTAVSTNPVTGSQTVTALERHAGFPQDLRVHVIGQGPGTASLVGRLALNGIEVSIGIVPETDVAAETARSVASTIVTAPPFEPITDDITRRAIEEAERADVTIISAPVTPPNLDVLAEAPSVIALEGTNPPTECPVVSQSDLSTRLAQYSRPRESPL